MNEFKLKIIHFFLSGFFTFWLLKIFIPLFKKFIPAKPNNRSLHNSIKASSGGITFRNDVHDISNLSGVFITFIFFTFIINWNDR